MYDRKGKGLISTRHLGSLMRNLGQNPQEQELSDILDEFTNGSMCYSNLSFCLFLHAKEMVPFIRYSLSGIIPWLKARIFHSPH